MDKTDTQLTALIFAATRGHVDIVNFLLREGADIEYKATDGDTALTASACCLQDLDLLCLDVY